LEKVEFLLKELEFSKTKLFNRLNELINAEKRQQDELQEKGVAPPVFSFTSLEHDFSDVEINVQFKSYLFTIQHAIKKIFQVFYLTKKVLRYDNKAIFY